MAVWFARKRCGTKRVSCPRIKAGEWRGDDRLVARTLRGLVGANRWLDPNKEEIQQKKEALGIYEPLGNVGEQAECLDTRDRLFFEDSQLDAAEEGTTRVINSLLDKGEEFRICQYLTVFLVISTIPRARERKSSTTSRPPSGSHQLEINAMLFPHSPKDIHFLSCWPLLPCTVMHFFFLGWLFPIQGAYKYWFVHCNSECE